MLKKINLQLFAEGDTNPDEKKEANLENKPDTKAEPVKDGFSIRKAFGLKDKEPAKKEEPKPDVKPDEKKSNEKPEDKKPDTAVIPEKEPAKEPEFDEILYNKEKVKIPVTERQTYLQKGYNYDKVKQTADTASAALLRAAKLEGFNTADEYLAELDKRDKVKLAEKIEEAAGDPEKIDEIVKNHPRVVETQEKERKIAFKEARDELAKDKFFKELEPQFDEMAVANPAVDPKLLYKIIRSDYLTPDKLNELITKEKESAEKKVIADVHDKERRAAPTGGDTDDGKDVVQPSAFTNKLAGIFGVSASKIAQRSHEKLKRS